MKIVIRKTIKDAFSTVCISVVSFMVSYWVYKYQIEDRDIANVDFISIQDVKDTNIPYPTLCFKDPIIQQKLREINERFKLTENSIDGNGYIEYLKGVNFFLKFKDIDFKNVSLDLNDYFFYAQEFLRNESLFRNVSRPIDHLESFNGFYQNDFIKCFMMKFETHESWQTKAMIFRYDLQKLLDDLKPVGSKLKFYFKLHPTEQFLVGRDPLRGYLTAKSSYQQIRVNSFEVLSRRSSRKRRCSERSHFYGTMIVEEHLKEKGCRPPYLNSDKNIPLCHTVEKIKEVKFNYEAPQEMKIESPCQMISNINLLPRTGFRNRNATKEWRLLIEYPIGFKVVTQSKEVDIHSLIGNIGGYLGLFLGKLLILNQLKIVIIWFILVNFSLN